MQNENLNKLKRLGRIMSWAAVGLICVLLAVAMWTAYAIATDPAFLKEQYKNAAIDITLTPPWVKASIAAISLAGIGILIFVVSCFFNMFRQLAAGSIFNTTPAVWMRRGAFGILAYVVFNIAQTSTNITLLSLSNPPGKRLLSIGINSEHVVILFFAGVFIVVAHMLVLASQIDEENKGFV